MSEVQLQRDRFGRLAYTPAGEQVAREVVPVRAFPITAPDDGIALVDREGREILWIDRLDQLPTTAAALIAEELAAREFIPEIIHIRSVSGFVTPCTWTVDTDRGATSFVLKGQDDLRRMDAGPLLITDKFGIQFLIRDLEALDKKSRRLLDRFL